MRAILIKDGKGPIENLYFGERPEPEVPKDYVLVKIKAFGLNGMDPIQRRGEYPLPPGTTDILGVEFSGHVSAVGEGVSKWKQGDEVFGLAIGGAYAEYIAVNQTYILPKPSHLSWVDAASIPEVYITAYQALFRVAQIKRGENVLIHSGASGVGLAAIQLARMSGANSVITTASTKEKLDWLLSIPNGATHTVNYKTEDFAAVAMEVTNGKGVDVIVDFVGQSHWTKNIEALAYDGRMVHLAMLSGSIVKEMDLKKIIFKRLHILGSTLRARDYEYKSALISDFGNEFGSSITGRDGEGPIKTYVQKVYSWKDIHAATHTLEAGKGIGKIVMEVD
ncbi:quinone oxidoreductase [Rhodocollybia butyracea]|uniref:Quinone oxidoreductase n=1 Tax=Rhodocollybia butyracea TaxID=206335 RepID=A0A9P5PWT7_9AGAR|nr:quinone oxidoreductase [Rhodocollybia butyracea]